jgi:hypothetical protein
MRFSADFGASELSHDQLHRDTLRCRQRSQRGTPSPPPAAPRPLRRRGWLIELPGPDAARFCLGCVNAALPSLALWVPIILGLLAIGRRILAWAA